jgi:hypothetical protein
MAVRLLALRADWLLCTFQEDFWYSFLLRGGVDPRTIKRPEGLGKLKKSNDHIGNRTGIFQLVV